MNDSHSDGDSNDAPRPSKKQRKQRPCYSCEECRRLKMKCDRQVPCSNCVRRHRVDLCNGASTGRRFHRREPDVLRGSQPQGSELQQPQQSTEQTQNASSPFPSVNHRELQQDKPLQHPDSSQPQPHNPLLTSVQWPVGGHDCTPANRDARTQDKLEQFALLARSLGPYIFKGTPSPRPSLVPASEAAASLSSAQSRASDSSQTSSQPANHGDHNGSHGTLMLFKGGRSKYLGPTAGSEWLKDSEVQDVSVTPVLTRAPTPELPPSSASLQSTRSTLGTTPIAFPFNASAARISTRDLLSHLPPRDEGWTLVESYYRYCAWHHDVAPKTPFEKTFDRVYSLLDGGSGSVNPQEIALVFIILAQGTMHNIEMAINASSAEEWLHVSERALVKGDFLWNNTIAGVQTLHLMAHLQLHLDQGLRGDNAWPLWGLVMRLIQAMGMHRDGARWDLPQDVVEERRKVFWECNAADTFQAHCFSRPCAINPEHCDTAFPTEPLTLTEEKSYSILRYELSQLSSEILNMAMKVRKPDYSTVTDLDNKLCEFERNLPFPLRSRTAFLSMPSRYPQIEAAIKASPEPSRRSMTISFQQANLALNISETIINLHRPYYAKALYENLDDRVNSTYAHSYLSVIERCAMIISLVADIHARFPTVSTRQWNFWYHVFGSALCLGTLVLRDPSNDMAAFVLAQIDAAINLFTSLIQNGASTPRYHRNLQWLLKLHARASAKVSRVSGARKADEQTDVDTDRRRTRDEREDGEDLELLGWRTRLIQRAGQHSHTIRTIGSHLVDISNLPPNQNRLGDHQRQSNNVEGISPSDSLLAGSTESTDDLLRGFWDSMLPLDIFEAPQDQPNHLLNNGLAWWEDNTTGH